MNSNPCKSRPLPEVLRIEPASACNLRCTHCPTGVIEMPRAVMKENVFKRALHELANNTPPIRTVVLYHGGEPFLNKNFLSIVERVKETGVPFIKTVSNGMLLNSKLIRGVVDSGLDSIEISIDGENSDENDRIRRRSKFEVVANNILNLAREVEAQGGALEIVISTTQFLKRSSNPDLPPPVPEWLSERFRCFEDVIKFKTQWAMLWPSGLPETSFSKIRDDRSAVVASQCRNVDETFTIRSDGRVVACCFDLTSMSNLGNILDQSLSDIWHGAAYRDLRSGLAEGSPPDLCKSCAMVTGGTYLVEDSVDSTLTTYLDPTAI